MLWTLKPERREAGSHGLVRVRRGGRPGYEEEYKRRHDEIWSKMVQALEELGIRTHSILRQGLTRCDHVELDSLEHALGYLRGNQVNRRLGDWMAPVMKSEVDPKPGSPTCFPCSGISIRNSHQLVCRHIGGYGY